MSRGAVWRWLVRNRLWVVGGVVGAVLGGAVVGTWTLQRSAEAQRAIVELALREAQMAAALEAASTAGRPDWNPPPPPASPELWDGWKQIKVRINAITAMTETNGAHADLGAAMEEIRAIEEMMDELEWKIRASRVFAGPEQYPPRQFSAYGIVAFPSAASEHDAPRYLHVCQAYMAVLPHTSELPKVPQHAQMVTVWPLTSEVLADDLNEAPRIEIDSTCKRAVAEYDVVTARRALREAEVAGAMPLFEGEGPYLLAWAPGAKKGAPDALVLVADLSYITEYGAMRDVFVRWAEDIEQNPELWRKGWRLEQLRATIRAWADHFGPRLLSLVTGGS